MINLRLHDTGDLAVALRAAPDLPLLLSSTVAQLADGRVVVSPDLIRKRQVRGIENPWFGAGETQQTSGLLHDEARIGALSQ